ncbi:MAG: response regulator [Candidatus Sulfotelmatobacter sp.]
MARKILLADDSVTAQNMGRKILADAGYEVVTVNNGSAALKKIAEIKPDLVILDVYMPGYSGLEVCQRLKESPDSARIPVLLTVGKLEPFKPEEAQRVRAEAFIVKPFEASELLSALSKLEDKVVPRSEPSKPGRFARAMASAEESSRSRIQPVSGDDEDGWKSRIGFPHEKKETEEKVADEASIYNPMNRDLRTVVASAAERVEEKKEAKKEEKRLHEMAVEPSLDVEAVAPLGTPQDVTPEEVAAIAAAAAQIQTLQATLDEERRASENVTAPQSIPEGSATAEVPVDVAVANALGSTEGARPGEVEDIPMTMAAASAEVAASSVGGPRWTAVAVALDADEANVSLEQEMQRAYTAFLAEQSASAGTNVEQVFAVEGSSAPAEIAVEQAVATTISNQDSQPEPEKPAEPAVIEAHPAEHQIEHEIERPIEVQGEVRSESVMAVLPEEVATHLVVAAEPVAVSEPAEFVPQPEPESSSPHAQAEAVESHVEAVASHFTEPVSEATVESGPAVIEPMHEQGTAVVQELPSAPEAQPAIAEDAASTHGFTSFVSAAGQVEEHHEAQVESQSDEGEHVKSTAAAWASWRQIRDGNEPQPVSPQAQPPESAMPAGVHAEAAAMAVAAGAEQRALEVTPPSAENPTDVASIVDSVLADLRPRLMAEISRKMAEKK